MLLQEFQVVVAEFKRLDERYVRFETRESPHVARRGADRSSLRA